MRLDRSLSVAVIAAGALACESWREAERRPSPGSTPVVLSAEEKRAVKVAENFVAQQCYTVEPCDLRRPEMFVLEITDFDPKRDIGPFLLMRKGTIRRAAFGISTGIRSKPGPGWTVYFEPNDPDSNYVRGLYLTEEFSPMGFEHLPLRRDAPDKVLGAGPKGGRSD